MAYVVFEITYSNNISSRFCITALLLLYDVTNKVSFDNIRAWLSEIRDYAHEQVVITLIGIPTVNLYIFSFARHLIANFRF